MNTPEQEHHSHHFAMYMILGIIAVLAVFVLMIFSQSIVHQALDDTEEQYAASTGDVPGFQELSPEDFARIPPVGATDPVRSLSPTNNYRLTIIEYGDFECGFCAEMADNLSRILSVFDDVRLVWKDAPSPLHFEAGPAALAARCAQEQGMFWEYHDALFANQEVLGTETYKGIASLIGLNGAEFGTCTSDATYQPLVAQGIAEAEVYGISGTPYLFVGDTIVDQLISYEQLEELVQEEREKITAGP